MFCGKRVEDDVRAREREEKSELLIFYNFSTQSIAIKVKRPASHRFINIRLINSLKVDHTVNFIALDRFSFSDFNDLNTIKKSISMENRSVKENSTLA